MRKPKAPCTPECADRETGCHGKCAAYLTYREEWANYSAEVFNNKATYYNARNYFKAQSERRKR